MTDFIQQKPNSPESPPQQLPSLTLVVLAAGMGSRFGGLKQVEPLGPNGEFILHYSIYDAFQAGFDQVVLVIKTEHEPLFRQALQFQPGVQASIRYAYQRLDDIPKNSTIPSGRTKFWGVTRR